MPRPPTLTPARIRAAVKHLEGADKRLAKVIAAWGPCTLRPDDTVSPYESLARSIVYQQLNGTAAGTIFGRFRALYHHGGVPTPEELIGTPEERLRTAGLSRAKALALVDLAHKAREGVVPSHAEIVTMDDEAIIEQLTQIRGIGRWTVEMMLMFKLGRADVLPTGDYGVRNGFAIAYGKRELPTPGALEAFGERWRPYRSVAAWYLWRAVDLSKAAK